MPLSTPVDLGMALVMVAGAVFVPIVFVMVLWHLVDRMDKRLDRLEQRIDALVKAGINPLLPSVHSETEPTVRR